MIRLALRASLACLVVLAACSKNPEQSYQGWIEANLIFVSPDEIGRIETQPVREGDQVEPKTLLFTLDDDLQRAEVMEREAAVKNAQAGLSSARSTLLKTAAGTQKSLRGGRGRHALDAGAAQFRRRPSSRAARRSARPTAPCSRSISASASWCRPAVRWSRSCRRAT